MNITEVRVKLLNDPDDRLRAICSMTIDNAFVVRDLKIIERESGLFVAMPSRKLSSYCPHCGQKNQLRVSFCNQCGRRLQHSENSSGDTKEKLYADIAHPINSASRHAIENRIIAAYELEKQKAQNADKTPGALSERQSSGTAYQPSETGSPANVQNRRTDANRTASSQHRPLVLDTSSSQSGADHSSTSASS